MTRDEHPIEKSEVDQPVPGRLRSALQPREDAQAYEESASYRASTAVCQTHRFFSREGISPCALLRAIGLKARQPKAPAFRPEKTNPKRLRPEGSPAVFNPGPAVRLIGEIWGIIEAKGWIASDLTGRTCSVTISFSGLKPRALCGRAFSPMFCAVMKIWLIPKSMKSAKYPPQRFINGVTWQENSGDEC